MYRSRHGYIATDLEINDFAGSKTQLDTALEKADWHTWENEQDTDCNVCGYKREVAPEPEVTTSTATAIINPAEVTD